MSVPSAKVPGVEYHYIITLQWSEGDEHRITLTSSWEGVYTLYVPGTTRQEAYLALVERTRKHFNVPEGGDSCTLFFALEPMALAGPRLEPAGALEAGP
ncbi:hypothetical protein [Streptacidiphilus sp. EB129]|uniref:hypothetical protein n=1 Tax=Streptacidiphilus sp. EB129 TaxID=3156262 RepID=UPI00351748C9